MIELLCIGNAIVDVFASVDSAWLDGLGITSPVQHIPRDHARRILEELSGRAKTDIVMCSGGAAANVAKIAAMLGIGTAFTGCIGAPENGELAAVFRGELEAAGVVPLLTTGAGMTGLCFVFGPDELVSSGELVSPGDTRIAVSPGASLEFTETDASAELIASAGALVLDGFMLSRPPLVQHILQLAGAKGIPAALDAASVPVIREHAEAVLRYSRSCPLIIFMNADECIAFYNTIKKGDTGDAVLDEGEKENLILQEICPALKHLTGKGEFPVIVFKLGSRGAVVLAGGNVYREETTAIIPRNSVGAGDAFCAAFVSAWIRGRPVQDCAALGNRVAREILSVPGTKIKAEKLKSFAMSRT